MKKIFEVFKALGGLFKGVWGVVIGVLLFSNVYIGYIVIWAFLEEKS